MTETQRTAGRRLWYTADKSALVEEGDPRAAILAAAPGDPVPGGLDVSGGAEPDPAASPPPGGAETKGAAPKPNKARARSRNKGRE